MSRTRRGLLFAAGLAPPVAALFLYLQYIRVPPGYVDPMTLPRSLVEERARSFRRKANELASSLLSGRPFRATFTEEEVNAYITRTLAATGRAWYERFGLPLELEGVQLRFRPGTVTLMARWEGGKSACILGMRLEVTLTEEGALRGRVVGAEAGRLPVPRALVGRLAGAVEERPLVLRLGDGRRVRLRGMNLGEGTLHLAGGPGPAGRR